MRRFPRTRCPPRSWSPWSWRRTWRVGQAPRQRPHGSHTTAHDHAPRTQRKWRSRRSRRNPPRRRRHWQTSPRLARPTQRPWLPRRPPRSPAGTTRSTLGHGHASAVRRGTVRRHTAAHKGKGEGDALLVLRAGCRPTRVRKRSSCRCLAATTSGSNRPTTRLSGSGGMM